MVYYFIIINIINIIINIINIINQKGRKYKADSDIHLINPKTPAPQ